MALVASAGLHDGYRSARSVRRELASTGFGVVSRKSEARRELEAMFGELRDELDERIRGEALVAAAEVDARAAARERAMNILADRRAEAREAAQARITGLNTGNK